MWLFLALLLVPLIEIALFIEVGGWIGLWPTIGAVILTAVIGTLLLRRQGIAALRDLQGRLAAGRDPGAALAHGAMILVAGILLLTPGFFTDAAGLLLLVPAVRAAAIAFAARRITVVHAASGPAWRRPGAGAHTVEGDYEDVTDRVGPGGGRTADPAGRPGRSGWTRGPGAGPDGDAGGG